MAFEAKNIMDGYAKILFHFVTVLLIVPFTLKHNTLCNLISTPKNSLVIA